MNQTTPQLKDIRALQRQYLAGALQPRDVTDFIAARIAASGRPEVWISRASEAHLARQCAALELAWRRHGEDVLERMPLFGVPFAVKDNIDVEGLPTTAACPAFCATPVRSAEVVRRLQAAGAIMIGKTNLDQFATGLVGTRSPYGAVRNALHEAYVSGGSSSGSAVAVALELVSFSLGTDTAGSGRVPAGFNGVVGLKPTRGLFSSRGVVPACRTLDCVSVFAHSVADAWRVAQSAAGYDPADPYSRPVPMLGPKRHGYRIGVPDKLEFFGDAQAEAAFAAALQQVRDRSDCTLVSLAFRAFVEAAKLLYAGPWVAERRAAIGVLFDEQPDAIESTVRTVVAQADRYSAVDAFNGMYRLAELRRTAEQQMTGIDFLLVPTAPTMPTLAAVAAEPVRRNSELGYYTNFVNFFDMAALAVPGVPRGDGLPAGVTLIGPAGSDHLLAAAGMDLFPAGAVAPALAADPLPFGEPTVRVAVVGAHLDGQPLNWQLVERGARMLRRTRTTADYRLYALPDTVPPKPGLARVAKGGDAIEVEVWEMPERAFGSFVAEIPPPLGIGTLTLEDGANAKGFICEPWALAGATDITSFGGWRAYLANR